MEPYADEVNDGNYPAAGDRNPRRAYTIVGALIVVVLGLAGAAVVYLYLQAQGRLAETNAGRSVVQAQPAIAASDPTEEANARAAADKLLAETLTRQATQAVPPPALAAAAAPSVAVVTSVPAAALPQPSVEVAGGETAKLDPQSTGSTTGQQAAVPPQLKVDPLVPLRVDVPAVVPSPAPSPPPSLSQDEVSRLHARATAMLQQGDIASARLILDRLARGGDAKAAFALAETYDPVVLAQLNVRGIKADAARAKALYGQAFKAGISEARDRLTALGN